MKLSELLKNGKFTGRFEPETEITNVCSHLDNCTDGSLFVAVSGSRFDGAAHINEAFSMGAKAVVTEKSVVGDNILRCENALSALAGICAAENGDPQKELTLVGLTGTNGKTSTSYILAHVLNGVGIKTEVIGSVNFENTTPEPNALYPALRRMKDGGAKAAICEVSSQGLDQRRVDPCRFRVGEFLNFGRDHLDYHKTVTAYFESKKRLKDLSDIFIVNGDDRYASSLVSDGVKTFSALGFADYAAKDIVLQEKGSEFLIEHKDTKVSVRTELIGMFNVYNTLAAIAAAAELGVSLEDIARTFDAPIVIPGRMERVFIKAPFSVYVDYAHTPQALTSALVALRKITRGRLIVVFGCGGDRDKEKRPVMGKNAARFADEVIVTSDNPRAEDPEAIIRDIVAGMGKDTFSVVPDRRDAIKLALSRAHEGDTVLVAGKGHEKYQIVGKRRLPFNDVSVIAEYEYER